MPTVAKQDGKKDLASSAQLGVELGAFIAGLRVSDEVKEALLILIEEASPKQLIALRDALAHALLMEATQETDAEYEKRLRSLAADFKKQQEELLNRTEEKIGELEVDLQSKSGTILI